MLSHIYYNYKDDGTGRVYVVGARGATGLVLTVASEVFEESGRSLVRGTLDYLQGLKVHDNFFQDVLLLTIQAFFSSYDVHFIVDAWSQAN